MRVELVNPKLRELRKVISEAFAAANGKLRARTLQCGDPVINILSAEIRRFKNGASFRHGGRVANSYGYPASSAAFFACWATVNGKKIVTIAGFVSSSNGSYYALRANTRDKLVRENRWVELVVPTQYYPTSTLKGLQGPERDLVAAILQSPNDSGLRLVYADWLDENFRSGQAQEIRRVWGQLELVEAAKPV